jgi:hypothetical protein
MPTIHGDEIHGEVVSTDASGGVAGALYDASRTTARTQLATEILAITDIIFISTAGGTYDIVFYPLSTGVIADGAGLRAAKGIADAHGGLAHHFETPIYGPKGYGLALIAASGQVDFVFSGFLAQA